MTTASLISVRFRELTRKTSGFRHTLADGLDAAVTTKILQLSSWSYFLSQSELRLPLLQVVSSNKYFSVGVQSPTEINAPRGCAVILKRRCQLALTRITHQVSRAFDLNLFHLHDGTACHACTHDIDKISTVLHAQLKTSCVPYGTYLRNTVPVLFRIHKVNQRAQHSGNLIIIYMCTWQAVPSCKWNKLETNSKARR